MSDVDRLERIVLALADPVLRVAWLEQKLGSWPPHAAARLLNALCEESERSDPNARETLLAVASLLVARSSAALVETLRLEVAEQRLLALDRLVRRAPPPILAERSSADLPVPDYGVGRELTLGERRSLARRPNRRAFDKLVHDPHPLVIRQLLGNPKLTEDDVVRLAARRPARLEVLHELADAPRWLSRARVRRTIVMNPGSPPEIAIPLLSVCNRRELLDVLKSTDTSVVLRAIALELLERRPPLPGVDHADAVLQ